MCCSQIMSFPHPPPNTLGEVSTYAVLRVEENDSNIMSQNMGKFPTLRHLMTTLITQVYNGNIFDQFIEVSALPAYKMKSNLYDILSCACTVSHVLLN
jgi:hypothetical protein